MDAFRDNFLNPGTHVCLDGPSGAGKTSLALTFLVRSELPYVYVPITRATTWQDFCRLLLKPVDNSELGMSADFEVGIDKGLPSGKLRVSLSSKGRASDDTDWIAKTSELWTEQHVVDAVSDQKVAVLVDDTENASEKLLPRLADLCKLMTTKEMPLAAKLCFIGTDHIYRRLLHSNPALDQRLLQTTLGAFNDRRHSWHFLTIGFEKLSLRQPGNSLLAAERAMEDSCIAAVYDAADGLPKSLNALGQKIAFRVPKDRKWVSAEDILTCSRNMVDLNWRQYNTDFPKVLRVLDEFSSCRSLVRAIYRRGVARVHHVSDILVAMASDAEKEGTVLTEELVRTSLEKLAAVDFLVLTGKAGEVVYVTKPTAAHTLGVAIRDSSQYETMRSALRERDAVCGSFPVQSISDAEVVDEDAT